MYPTILDTPCSKIPLRQQCGFTLVEAMVGLAIGSLVAITAATLFSSSREVSRTAEGISLAQQNARYVMEQISSDIKKAGYMGCSSHIRDDDAQINVTNSAEIISPNPPISFAVLGQGIIGANGSKSLAANGVKVDPRTVLIGGSNSGQDYIGNRLVNGEVDQDSSFLLLQYAQSPGFMVVEHPSNSESSFKIADHHTLKANDILVISDCESAHVFKANRVSNNNRVTPTTPLSKNYASSTISTVGSTTVTGGNTDIGGGSITTGLAEVSRFVTHLYYLGKADGTSTDSGTGTVCPAHTLCRKRLVPEGSHYVIDHLIENVEDFDVSFNVDSDLDGVPDYFESGDSGLSGEASTLIGYNNLPPRAVISVRVGLKLRRSAFQVEDIDPSTIQSNITDSRLQGISNYFTQTAIRIRVPAGTP